MLVEIRDVRQVPGEGRRRWFTDRDFDLIVWYADEAVNGFQLCYDKQNTERALTWYRPARFVHTRVDTGEAPFGPKKSPVLVQDGVFDRDAVAHRFRRASRGMDPEIAGLVSRMLAEYASEPAGA